MGRQDPLRPTLKKSTTLVVLAVAAFRIWPSQKKVNERSTDVREARRKLRLCANLVGGRRGPNYGRRSLQGEKVMGPRTQKDPNEKIPARSEKGPKKVPFFTNESSRKRKPSLKK